MHQIEKRQCEGESW